MKRAVIIHGWEGHPDECWFPWLKSRLEELGYSVEVPQMPEPDNPKLDKWLPHLKSVIGEPDKEMVLIGHSLANITILRFLEELGEKQAVGKVIMVAGFSDYLGFKEIENFFERPIQWEKIRKHCSDFTAIHSDNDPYVPLKYADIFKERLGAKIIIEHGKGHMGGKDKTNELLSVLKALEENRNKNDI